MNRMHTRESAAHAHVPIVHSESGLPLVLVLSWNVWRLFGKTYKSWTGLMAAICRSIFAMGMSVPHAIVSCGRIGRACAGALDGMCRLHSGNGETTLGHSLTKFELDCALHACRSEQSQP